MRTGGHCLPKRDNSVCIDLVKRDEKEEKLRVEREKEVEKEGRIETAELVAYIYIVYGVPFVTKHKTLEVFRSIGAKYLAHNNYTLYNIM